MKHLVTAVTLIVLGLFAWSLVGRDEGPRPMREDGVAAPEESGSGIRAGETTPTAPPSERLASSLVTKDPLVAAIAGTITDLMTGEKTRADRAVLERRIADALTREQLADEQTVAAAARSAVDLFLDEAGKARRAAAASAAEPTAQMSIIKAMAQRYAASLRRGLMGSGLGAIHTDVFLTSAIDVELPEGYEKAEWSVLGGFEYKEGMTLPEPVRRLDGKRVGIAGYMMSLGEFEDIHEFLLVESQWSCCFGEPPDVHQVVVVTIPDGEDGIELLTTPVLVLGTLDVGEEKEDGWVTSVYRIRAEIVEPLE